MNYTLILEALLAIGELAARIAETRGYDGPELDAYIEARTKLRRELMSQVLDDAQQGGESEESDEQE